MIPMNDLGPGKCVTKCVCSVIVIMHPSSVKQSFIVLQMATPHWNRGGEGTLWTTHSNLLTKTEYR